MSKVSVVVATYNRIERLKKTLAGLAQQTFPLDQLEVVVVSDGSSDGTSEFLQGYVPSFTFTPILQKNQGVASARNQGYQRATGELVLFVDDDIIPAPQLVEQHLGWHQKYGEKAVVIGPMLSPAGYKMSPWVQWEQVQLARQYRAMLAKDWEPTARQFYTGNTSLRREFLVQSGGFDPSFRRAEDVELAYRLVKMGAQFYFNPEAVGYHYPERSLKAWLDIPYAYGRNDVIFTFEKGQDWLLPVIFREFHSRNLIIRALIWGCLGRPILSNIAMSLLKTSVVLGERIHFKSLSQTACSGLFNLRHYQGISDQLGGRRLFFDGVTKARAA